MKKTTQLMVTVFGAGLMPVAPGTWGSAVAAAIFMTLGALGATPMALLLAMAALLGYGSWATLHFGPEVIAEKGDDPGLIVSDEVAGQAITFLWIWNVHTWPVSQLALFTVAGFILFRLFDIVKPWPACYFDRMNSSLGVLMDDIAAGVYAAIVLQALWRLGWLASCANWIGHATGL